jgi:hypothetical protein
MTSGRVGPLRTACNSTPPRPDSLPDRILGCRARELRSFNRLSSLLSDIAENAADIAYPLAIIFGRAFATVLTLGTVPVLYSLFYRVRFNDFVYQARD